MNSSVLLMVRTATNTGSQLVATLHTNLDSTLEEIRMQLVSIAAAAKSGKEIVPAKLPPKTPPANLTQQQVEAIMAARLHPFELAAPFRFVRRGGSLSIARGKEATLKLVDVLPVVPPWGLPSNTCVWGMAPPPATIVLPRPTKGSQPPSTPSSPAGGLCEALAVLFVAQGDFGDEMHSEKVVMERLHMQAVSYGRQANPKQLASFLHKWNANVKDLLGRSLLQEHALEGNAHVVKYLLSLAYVRVSDGDYRGDTALHLAVWKGHLDIVTALLVAGANPLQQNNLGQTSLHVALLSCQDTILDVLCKRLQQQQVPREALAGFKDHHGLSPLGLFHRLSPTALQLSSEGAVDALRALCNHYLYDRRRLTIPGRMYREQPLHEAAANGHTDLVSFLIDEMRVPVDTASTLDCCKRTPLHHAARNGHTAVVKRLLLAHADPNALDCSGRSPMLLALHFGRFETAEFILETCPHQALDAMDRTGISALHVASACGASRLLQLILDRNSSLVDLRHVVSGSVRRSAASANVPNPKTDPLAFLRFRRLVNQRYGRAGRHRRAAKRVVSSVPFQVLGPSPLWCAVHASAEGAVAVLLSRGAGRSGDDSPQFLAAILTRLLIDNNFDCAAAVVKLIGPGASAEVSVLAHFIETRQAATVRWLCDRRVGFDGLTARIPNAALCVAARVGDAACVKFLLSIGASPACGPADASPMLIAVRLGHDAVVHELILSGYRPGTGGDESTSPLVAAARFGQESILRGLIGLAPPSTFDAVTALLAAVEAPAQRKMSWKTNLDSICCVLLRCVNEVDSHIHPAELLHTLAAEGLWSAVDFLSRRLVALSPDQRAALAASLPALPVRPSEVISPAASSRSKQSKRGRKPLFPKPVPFARYIPFTAGTAHVPVFKQKVRDCISFLVEARRLELVESLVCDVGIAPSAGVDVRGMNSADYALRNRHYEMLVLLVAANVVPQPSRMCGVVGCGKLRALVEACRSTRHCLPAVVPAFARVASCLVSGGHAEVLRDLLAARLHVAKSVPQKVLLLLVQRAVAALQLPMVKLLIAEHHCDPSVLLGDVPELGMTLVAAVLAKGMAPSTEVALLVVHCLAARRCPLNAPSIVPPAVARTVKRAVGVDLGSGSTTKVEPSFVLAAHRGATRLLVEIMLAARQSPSVVDGPVSLHSPLLALVVAAPHFPPEHVDKSVSSAVAALATGGSVYSSHSIIRTAARKGLLETCRELVARYGAECVLADLKPVGALTSLHFFARSSRFNGLLSDLLFEARLDDAGDNMSDSAPVPKVTALMAKLPGVSWDGPRGSPFDEALRSGNVDAAAMLAAANVFSARPVPPTPARLQSNSLQIKTAQAFSRVARLHNERRRHADYKGYTILHAAAELDFPDLLDRLLVAFAKAPQDLPLPRFQDSVLCIAARHATGDCARAVLRQQSSPLLRGISTSHWMLFVLSRSGGAMWDLMLSDHRGGAADVHSPLPTLSVLQSLPAMRSRVHLPFCHSKLAKATPIVVAIICEDEAALHQLLALGASAACSASVLTPEVSARLRMQEKYATARRRWKASSPDSAPARPARRKPHIKKPTSTVAEDAAAALLLDTLVTPAMLALALMAANANIATHTPGTSPQKLSGAASTFGRMFLLLIRSGGLSCDRMTASDYNAMAVVLIILRQWELLQALVDELLRLRRDIIDGDRFFGPIEGCSPLLRRWVGSNRHPAHAAVKHAPREVLITVARHSQRVDIETCKDCEGRTAAYHAVRSTSQVAFDTLSALQIPMNSVCDSRRRRTPLMIASKEKRLVIVTQLLKLSDVVNQRDSEGNTALMLAAARGAQEIVELLLSAQADSSVVNDAGLPALFLAAMNGHDSIALPLCQHFTRTDGFTTAAGTALHFSAVGGCKRTTEFLVRTYDTLGVLQPDAAGHTPLYLAYCFGHDQVLRTLLSALQQRTEKPPTVVDDRIVMCSSTLRRYGWLRGVLALADALYRETRKKGAPKLLTAPGEQVLAPVTPPLRKQKSLLMWCAKANNAVGVRVCADHNMMDDCYALHMAARHGAIDVVQLLVTLDMSDPNAPNEAGKLALDVALENNKESVAVFLAQRMRINLGLLKPLPENQGSKTQNIFHRVGSSLCGASVLPIIVTRLTNLSLANTSAGKENVPSGSGNYDPAVLSVLEALQRPDDTGLTPFECAISVGTPALVLRIAQALQVLGTAAGQEVSVALSASLLASLPSLSPAIRVVLYDFFNVAEVASSIGFGRGATSSQRASFADVRMIGVNALRREPYCGPKMDAVFTVEHERNTLKHLTQLLDVPFRLRFKPEALRGLTPAEQVNVLQRIGTSSVLGKYLSIVDEKLFQIGSLELELGQSRTDVRVDVVGSTVCERFFVGGGRGAVVVAPNASAIIQKLMGSKVRDAKLGVDSVLKAVATEVRALGHPLLQGFKISVDWNGFTCPKASSDLSVDSITTVSLRDAQSQYISESACNVLLGTKGLTWIRRVVLNRLQDMLRGTTVDELRVVSSASANQQPPTVTLVYKKQGAPCVTRGSAGPLDTTVEFSDSSIASIDAALEPVVRAVYRDTVLVQIHLIRDKFVQRVLRTVGKQHMGGDVLKFKLDVESAAVEDIPPHRLSELLSDTAASLEAVFYGTSLPDSLPTASGGKPAGLRRSQLTSANIIAQSVASGVRAVFILFSSRREPFARRSGNKLMLCFTPDLCPTRSCVYTALTTDTAVMECDKLREKLPLLVDDMQQRLHTYLPSSTLVLDAPSFTQLGDDENCLAALSLLFHNRSEHVLQAVVQGISVGWDTRLGAVVRKCVKQITVVLEMSSEAALTLQPNGNLVYFCPMLCIQNRTQHSWSLLTAPQIASLMIIQLLESHPEVAQLVETTRPFACWCTVHGKSTRQVSAGETRCSFDVETKSIINKKAACNAEEPLEFRGRLSSIRVTQKATTSKKSVVSALRVRFAAPTKIGAVPLHVMLHGHHLCGSPMTIAVRHAATHIPATTLISQFNTVVQDKPFEVELQLRDRFQNVVSSPVSKALQLCVDGPPGGNADGIAVKSWKESRPGVVSVTIIVQSPTQRCTIPIRVSASGVNTVVPISVEVITADVRRQLRLVRASLPSRVCLFFRSAMRRAERERQKRETRLLGGLKQRRFAPSH
jgi:ankyrin repeat protein